LRRPASRPPALRRWPETHELREMRLPHWRRAAALIQEQPVVARLKARSAGGDLIPLESIAALVIAAAVGAGLGHRAAASRSPKAADSEELATSSLVIETERAMLELVANGAPLAAVLDTLTRAIERISPQSLCTIMLLDQTQRRRLLMASGPSLPRSYLDAADGLEIGPDVGSCGSAAYRNETIIVEDIATDHRFAAARDFVLGYGLRSCWSQPIRDSNGSVLGTFATYRRIASRPRPQELRLARVAGQLAGNAIERIRAQRALGDAVRSLNLAETAARFGIWEADFERDSVTISSGLAALLERPAARCELSRSEFEAMVHPDDRDALWSGGEGGRRSGTLQAEFRLTLPSGALHWMRSQWTFVPGSKPETRATGAMIDITGEREMLLEMMRRAHHDSLTGLLNRASLYECLERLIGARRDCALALVYIDLDLFKEINDSLGHAAGDTVLQHVARQIATSVRQSDLVARIGGDEFVIVLRGVSDPAEALRSAAATTDAIGMPISVAGKSLRVEASLGISIYGRDAGDTDTLLKIADESMYRMKLSHRRDRLAREPGGVREAAEDAASRCA
jgi:diguanylate cyclase (GGDEF)-like protein